MIIYSVQKGETIQSIARKFDLSVDDLIKLNHLTADKPLTKHYLKLYVTEGKRPERTLVKARTGADNGKSAKPSVPEKPDHYIVKKGDNLARIAEQFDTTATLLCQVNKINPDAPLFVGKKLTIPCKDSADDKKAPAKPSPAPRKPACAVHRQKGRHFG